jgi:hypothetical protein
VTDGTHIAQIDFIGNYTLANFHFFSDGSGGTLVTDPPVAAGQGTALSSDPAEKGCAAPHPGDDSTDSAGRGHGAVSASAHDGDGGTNQSATGTSNGAGSDQSKGKPPATDDAPADRGLLTFGSNGMAIPDIAFAGIDLGQATTLANCPTTRDTSGSVGASASLQDRALALFSQYMSTFATGSEDHADTPLADPPSDQQHHLSLPHAS